MKKLFSVQNLEPNAPRSRHRSTEDGWPRTGVMPEQMVARIIFGKGRQRRGLVREEIAAGLEVEVLDRLAEALAVNQTQITKLLRIPAATLKRRRETGRLTQEESDRVYRYARLMELATALTAGDEVAARDWLQAPAPYFGGDTPLLRATSEYGAHEVEDLIGRIRHGIPS